MLVLVKTEKIREILADTIDGYGDNFTFPAKPSYENPIVAIHHINRNHSCMKFETKDGVVSAHPENPKLDRLAINPPDAAIAFIKVWIHTNKIYGIALLDEKH